MTAFWFDESYQYFQVQYKLQYGIQIKVQPTYTLSTMYSDFGSKVKTSA